MGVGIGVGVTVGVDVGVAIGVADGVGLGDGIGVAIGFGAAIPTPLFQTSLFPLLIHVYFLPAKVEVAPSFVHEAPALTAALAIPENKVNETNTARILKLFLTESSQFGLCHCPQYLKKKL